MKDKKTQQDTLKVYKRRMRSEKKQLSKKIGELHEFTESKSYTDLPLVQQQYIEIQLQAMMTYYRVLHYRMFNNF